jgi:magnesium-transporting ATPase (P-type)
MDLKSYSSIISTITFIPAIIVFITGCIVWYYYRKSERLMLILMKGIISRKNIDKRPTYLVCNRELPSSSGHHFMLNSLFVVAICIQCFFLIAIVDVHNPDLDCFKKKDDVKLSDTFAYDESPVNDLEG